MPMMAMPSWMIAECGRTNRADDTLAPCRDASSAMLLWIDDYDEDEDDDESLRKAKRAIVEEPLENDPPWEPPESGEPGWNERWNP